MKVTRKSVRDILLNPQPNEYYVLVTRYYPMEFRKRGLKLSETPIHIWDRNLAPSKELLKDVKEGRIGWKEYERRFRMEVPHSVLKADLDVHKKHVKGRTLVLVCVEKDIEYPHCHTWILLEMVKELTP